MTHTESYWPVKIAGDVTVCVQPNIKQMSSYVLLEQEDWFEDEMGFVRLFITPGMSALDIGANHGVYALTIAKKLATGHVWAFEPTSKPGEMLAKSIAINGFSDKVTWIHAGLSDHEGTAEIATSMNSELNSLYGNSGNKESIRLETLDACMLKYEINQPVSFVKLDAEGEEVSILKGGHDFFMRQSPLIMFELKHGAEVNHGLIEAFEQLGYGIFRLLTDLNILVEYDASYQNDVLNLFACKPDHAKELATRGLLAGREDIINAAPDNQTNSEDWLEGIRHFPYAQRCETEWLAHIDEVPENYLRALSACMKTHDKSLPAAKRVLHLQTASDILDSMLQNPAGAHYSIWLLKIHLLHLQNRRINCINFCQQLVVAFANAIAPSWPFVPPSEMFFNRKSQGPIGEWILEILQEFIQYRQSFSSYFMADPLTALLPILGNKNHDLAIERRFILGSKKAGKSVNLPQSCQLLDPEHSANSSIWNQILNP